MTDTGEFYEDLWDATEADRENASRRQLQRGLWLRGRLTVDPIQAELDFRRLAVLYPSGQFTPDALLRLAQSSWAMGDEAAARAYVTSLERDYPRSDARERAAAWLTDAGPLPPREDVPTRAVTEDPIAVEAITGGRFDDVGHTTSRTRLAEGKTGKQALSAPGHAWRASFRDRPAYRPAHLGVERRGEPPDRAMSGGRMTAPFQSSAHSAMSSAKPSRMPGHAEIGPENSSRPKPVSRD